MAKVDPKQLKQVGAATADALVWDGTEWAPSVVPTVRSKDWDTATGSLAVGEAAYINGNGSAEQANAGATSTSKVVGVASVLDASSGVIITAGDAPSSQLVTGLTVNAGDRLWLSKTAGAMTNDVSAFTTGDTVYPMGRVKDASGYTGGTPANSKVDMVVDLGEPVEL
jgi:hypothetical protein